MAAPGALTNFVLTANNTSSTSLSLTLDSGTADKLVFLGIDGDHTADNLTVDTSGWTLIGVETRTPSGGSAHTTAWAYKPASADTSVSFSWDTAEVHKGALGGHSPDTDFASTAPTVTGQGDAATDPTAHPSAAWTPTTDDVRIVSASFHQNTTRTLDGYPDADNQQNIVTLASNSNGERVAWCTAGVTATSPYSAGDWDWSAGVRVLFSSLVLFEDAGAGAQDMTPALAQQLVTTFAPTLSTGAVDVTLVLEQQLVQAFDPTVAASGITMTPELAQQLVVAFDPVVASVDQFMTPDMPTQLVTVFAPTVATDSANIAPALAQQLVSAFNPAIGVPGVWFDAEQNVRLLLEAAFGSNPFATSPTWYDISEYARRIKTRRGKQSAVGNVSPGTMTVTMSNSDGRFDPTYASGAYYPNVKPLVQIRLSAEYDNGALVELWRGYAEVWQLKFPKWVDETVELKAVDGFKTLNLVNTTTLENQENSGVRVGNLLDYAAFPAAWRNIDTGDVTISDLQTECRSVVQLIRQIEDTEGGWFYFAADGDATFKKRSHRAGLAVSATIGDAAGEMPYNQIDIDFDDKEIFNTVVVSRIYSSEQSVSDSASIAAHTIRTMKKLDLPFVDDTAALALANTLLTRYKDSEPRINSVTVIPMADPANSFDDLFGLELGDKVTVKRQASYHTISQDLYVEGVAHTIDVQKRKWSTKLSVSQVA